ncbi:MAG TPA: hypothetical protein VGR19_05970 [Allosphingosinicella sp.]|nr:hypothetical protein [Allosphingosinicella sp.]
MTITVAEAVDSWCTYRLKLVSLNLVAGSTYENQCAIAGNIKTGLGDLKLDALRKSHIEVWIGQRLADCAPVTVRGELNVLRQILNWCLDEQLLTTKPRLPTVSVPTTEKDLPCDDAFLWALRVVPEKHRQAFEFMMLTGLSPHEAERVQVRDWTPSILSDDGHGYVRIGQRPDFRVKQESRRRSVPLNERSYLLWHQLTAGLKPTEHPLPSGAAMQKVLARARLTFKPDLPTDAERITPKLMRQWFASKVANEEPEHVLQRLLGHAPGSPITRRHYVRSSDEQLVGATEGLRA